MTCEALAALFAFTLLAVPACNRTPPPCQEGAFSCGDGGRVLYRCEANRWTPWAACDGARACQDSPNGVACDQSRSERGLRCLMPEARACSSDSRWLLGCEPDAGRFESVRACAGPLGCTEGTGSLACDDSVAQVGDLCESRRPSFTCTPSGDAILKCVGNTYAVLEACSAPKRCTIGIDGGTIACSTP